MVLTPRPGMVVADSLRCSLHADLLSECFALSESADSVLPREWPEGCADDVDDCRPPRPMAQACSVRLPRAEFEHATLLADAEAVCRRAVGCVAAEPPPPWMDDGLVTRLREVLARPKGGT